MMKTIILVVFGTFLLLVGFNDCGQNFQAIRNGTAGDFNFTGKVYAECAQFGTGSEWGPIATANVILGKEPAVTVPIQIVDSSYASAPSSCGSPSSSPSSAGYNGILGIGFFKQDCGTQCTTDANTQMYYICDGSTCSEAAAPLAKQVSNPIASLPSDNNGVTMIMPTVAFAGSHSATGYLLLGIGTESNNVPSAQAKALTADDTTGEFTTDFAGTQMTGIIDSGSNGLFIPQTANYPDCTNRSDSNWFCPTSPYDSNGTAIGLNGLQQSFPFQIANASALLNSYNYAIMNLGGDSGGPSDFADIGFPFFYGRTVYIGLEHTTSSIGAGPYWAFSGGTTLVNSNGFVSQPSGRNVLTMQIGNFGQCSSGDYENEPCTSVTICSPGSATDCETINNILVDSGSYGLRLFSSVVTVNLTPESP